MDWSAFNYRSLLPALDEAAADTPYDLVYGGSISDAIAFAALYWPPFVEHDGCVFFGWSFSESNYDTWVGATAGDKAAIEAVLNHIHITDLFPRSDPPPALDQVLCVGRAMREAWQAKLKRDFPHRDFRVEFDETPSDDLEDYQITFWQPSNRR